jgi:hypothetical protein
VTLEEADTRVLDIAEGQVVTADQAEALKLVLDSRERALRLAESLADRVHKQSELPSASAERKAGTATTGSGI